jgi:hypothetical protein
MKYFYQVMVWLSEFDLAIAEATSTNTRYIHRLSELLSYWQGERDKHEVSHRA